MAKRVHEIMNHELFCVVADEFVGDVRGYFRAMSIAAAPVVDDGGRPIGFISLRDMLDAKDADVVSGCMTEGADAVSDAATVSEAAAVMADRGRHHLAVVGKDGRIVGYLGSLDVVRGLIGKPTPHPETFPHYDPALGLTWTDDLDLKEENATEAPDGPGFLRLIRIRAGQYDRVVWSEATRNVRNRVLQLVANAPPVMPHLVAELEGGEIRFRAAGSASLS